MAGKFICTRLLPTSVVDLKCFYLLAGVFVLNRRLFINFFCAFSSKFIFNRLWLKEGWGEEKYYKQLFDNDAYETTLSAFYTFKLIDTQQQLNTFLNPSI